MPGHFCSATFTNPQSFMLHTLIRMNSAVHKIRKVPNEPLIKHHDIRRLPGHEQISIDKKVKPGPFFPLDQPCSQSSYDQIPTRSSPGGGELPTSVRWQKADRAVRIGIRTNKISYHHQQNRNPLIGHHELEMKYLF